MLFQSTSSIRRNSLPLASEPFSSFKCAHARVCWEATNVSARVCRGEREREREPQNTSLLIISDADGNGKINVGIFERVTVQRRVSLKRSSRHRCAVGQRSKCGLIGRVSAARCHPPMASFVSPPLLADVWWVHTFTHLMVNMQCGGKKREREK